MPGTVKELVLLGLLCIDSVSVNTGTYIHRHLDNRILIVILIFNKENTCTLLFFLSISNDSIMLTCL